MRVPIILALFLISAALCNADSCQWQTSDGNNKYDLSSLVGKGSAEHGYYKVCYVINVEKLCAVRVSLCWTASPSLFVSIYAFIKRPYVLVVKTYFITSVVV